jgi:hypothetical protein
MRRDSNKSAKSTCSVLKHQEFVHSPVSLEDRKKTYMLMLGTELDINIYFIFVEVINLSS